MLCGENVARCLAREKLKTALCITDVANADYPKNRMQAVHEHISDQGPLVTRQNDRDREISPPQRTLTTAADLTR